MSKSTKIWLVTAASLVLVGCIVFGGVMTMLQWDFTKLSTNQYETSHYEINEAYSNVSIVTDTADIVLIASENSTSSVECLEHENARHTVTVKDGTLVVEIDDSKKWYEYIGINFGSPKIMVSIPQGEYGALSISSDTGDVEIPDDFQFSSIEISEDTGDVTSRASASGDVKIKTSSGSIDVEGISAGSLDLSVSTGRVTASDVRCENGVTIKVSTGKVYLTNMTCKSVISSGDTGDISLKNVIAAEKLSIERDTGDVTFERCDAAELFIKTDTGDVKGSLLSEKVFIADTNTGKKEIPDTTTGGRCEITTDTGDIRINIQQ